MEGAFQGCINPHDPYFKLFACIWSRRADVFVLYTVITQVGYWYKPGKKAASKAKPKENGNGATGSDTDPLIAQLNQNLEGEGENPDPLPIVYFHGISVSSSALMPTPVKGPPPIYEFFSRREHMAQSFSSSFLPFAVPLAPFSCQVSRFRILCLYLTRKILHGSFVSCLQSTRTS